MTREDAIKILKSKVDGHTDTSYEWVETVRMAIAALENESRLFNKAVDRVSEIIDKEILDIRIDFYNQLEDHKCRIKALTDFGSRLIAALKEGEQK